MLSQLHDSVGICWQIKCPRTLPPARRHGELEKSPKNWVPLWHLWKGGWFFHFPVRRTNTKTEEEIDILQQQELNARGRFPCRFPGCNKSFKYNGKTRRNHELFHHPRVQFKDSTIMTQSSPECTALQKETKAGDDVYNYNCAILADWFLFFNFLNAIKEGVGERIVQQYKYIMLSCKANGSHSTKYALECLTQFFFVFALLSQRDSKQFVWNRSVNNSGKKAANIPIDEDTEHERNAIKQGIRNIGPNVTKNAVQRIYFARRPTASILSNLVNSIKWQLPSGKHSHGNLERDLNKLIKRAFEFKIFSEVKGCSYKILNSFQRDRLANLDVSSLHH